MHLQISIDAGWLAGWLAGSFRFAPSKTKNAKF